MDRWLEPGRNQPVLVSSGPRPRSRTQGTALRKPGAGSTIDRRSQLFSLLFPWVKESVHQETAGMLGRSCLRLGFHAHSNLPDKLKRPQSFRFLEKLALISKCNDRIADCNSTIFMKCGYSLTVETPHRSITVNCCKRASCQRKRRGGA